MAKKGAILTLAERLCREPHRFDFFQAVRLLERLVHEQTLKDRRLRRRPIGEDATPRQELVRFRALPALSFPAGHISQLRRPATDDGPPPEMVVSFLGLTGPAGVLPQHYTTLLLRRLRLKDFALRDFLDLFNHRLVSLFYRAWEKYRLPFAYERSHVDGSTETRDRCTEALYCLVGLGTPHLRGYLEVDDEAFLFYAGHFAHAPRSATGLEAVLSDYFSLPMRVEQFLGQWLLLEEPDRSRLPGAGLGGLNNRLGVDSVAGERVWDVQGKFRVRVGPLRYRQFRQLMPGAYGMRVLSQLTRSYAGAEFDFDIQLVLRPEEVPPCRLGGDGEDGSFLGWNTWMRTGAFAQAVDDAVFQPEEGFTP
jgi:type VI secretion system protein ImpH